MGSSCAEVQATITGLRRRVGGRIQQPIAPWHHGVGGREQPKIGKLLMAAAPRCSAGLRIEVDRPWLSLPEPTSFGGLAQRARRKRLSCRPRPPAREGVQEHLLRGCVAGPVDGLDAAGIGRRSLEVGSAGDGRAALGHRRPERGPIFTRHFSPQSTTGQGGAGWANESANNNMNPSSQPNNPSPQHGNSGAPAQGGQQR